MEYDLIIKGGTVVDGSGSAGFIADVGIKGGVITSIGQLDGKTIETIDATGHLVTPGFVDIHTHFDGQVTWDSDLAPSCYHGVTTIVMGNCGVGFAPAAPDKHDFLIELMEGVEDIPGTALHEGIEWNWESFAEYLDELDRHQWTMDVATQVPHAAVRAYVMGDRGARNELATEDDLKKMSAIVHGGIKAGALGISTSRIDAHRTINGEIVPGTNADYDELWAIGSPLKDLGKGVFQVVPKGADGEMGDAVEEEIYLLGKLAKDLDRPLTFSLVQNMDDPGIWDRQLRYCKQLRDEGVPIYPQVANRATGIVFGLESDRHVFSTRPSYLEIVDLPLSERVERMQSTEFKKAILSETPGPYRHPAYDYMYSKFDNMFSLGTEVAIEPSRDNSIGAQARLLGLDPLSLLYDEMMLHSGKNIIMFPYTNYVDGSLDVVYEQLKNSVTVFGLGDAGAHSGVACDASSPTLMLAHWVRDRQGDKLSIEEAIHMMTRECAELFGLHDRGLVAEGYRADLNIIDGENIKLKLPEMHYDLPAGGRRVLQFAEGYKATIVSGVVTLRNDQLTGSFPGRLIRGEQNDPVIGIVRGMN